MEIIPLRDYVLLEELESTKTETGIILPENADIEPTNQGKIVKVSLPSTFVEWGYKFQEGDIVLFKRHMFDEVVVDKQKLLFGKQEHIVAVIKP